VGVKSALTARSLAALVGLSSLPALLVPLVLIWARPLAAHDEEHDALPVLDDADAPHDEAHETTVEGRAPARSGGRVVVDADAIHRFAPRAADDVLAAPAGVLVVQHGSVGKAPQIIVRGFDAAHGADLEVTLDGVPLNAWSHVHAQGYVDPTFVLPELIDAIVVDKGAFALHQGRFALAGTLDLRPGVVAHGERVKLEIGSLGRARLVLQSAPTLEVGHLAVVGDVTHDEGAGINRDGTRAVLNGLAHFTLAGVRVRSFAALARADFGLPGAEKLRALDDGTRRPFTTDTPFSRGESTRVFASLVATRSFETTTLDVRAHAGALATRFAENFTGILRDDDGDGRRQEDTRGSSSLSARTRTPLAPWLRLSTLAELTVDGVRQREDALDLALRPRRETRALDALLGAGALGGELSFTLLSSVVVDASLRADVFAMAARAPHAPQDGAAAVALAPALSPRLRATWLAWRGLSLHAAVGRGVRPAEARALSLDVAAPSAAPRVTGASEAELSARVFSSDERLALAVAGFATHVEDELFVDHTTGLDVGQGATWRAGLDLVTTLRPVDALLLEGSLALAVARFVDDGAPVPGVPPAFARFVVELTPVEHLALAARARLLSARPLANGAWAEPVALVDLALERAIGPLVVGVFVDNALDARDTSASAHFASSFDAAARDPLPTTHVVLGPPRQLRGALTLRF